MNTSLNKEVCIANQQRPKFRKGEVLRGGDFFRNLKRDEVAKNYADDNQDPARFGYKVKRKHWLDSASQGGLSVNMVLCIKNPLCSILVHPAGERYAHVVSVKLEALCACVKRQVVAQYEPVNDNGCHFELILEDGGVSDLMALMDFFDQFPPGKMPGSSERDPKKKQIEENTASSVNETYESVFTIHRNVRPKE